MMLLHIVVVREGQVFPNVLDSPHHDGLFDVREIDTFVTPPASVRLRIAGVREVELGVVEQHGAARRELHCRPGFVPAHDEQGKQVPWTKILCHSG